MLIKYNDQDVFSGQAEPFISKTTDFASNGDNRVLLEETLSLVGELTGCGIAELRAARSSALEVFSTGFKNLEVSGVGTFTGVRINALNFDQSPYLNTLPYSIELLHYPSGGYEFGHGITSPQSVYTYTENVNQTVSIRHEVSAQGINTSSAPGGNALTNAQNFVSGQIEGEVPRPALIDTTSNAFSTYLVDFSESVDKINNKVSVSRSFESDPTDIKYGGNVILRHTSSKSPTEGEGVVITYNGEINAGRPTGDAAFQDKDGQARMEKVRVRYGLFKDSLDTTLFLTENITEDTGINLLSFTLSHASGSTTADGIGDDFTITLEENSDSSLFSVSVNGNMSVKGRCIGEAWGDLSGFYDTPVAEEGEQSFDHRFDLCEVLYNQFYTTDRGSCQDKPAEGITLNRHSINKSVGYNEYAQTISYSASYNDRSTLDGLHSFDYKMNFTPSLIGIKSVASAYDEGWIFEDLGYRKRCNFSISMNARPLTGPTDTNAQKGALEEFGEGKFQSFAEGALAEFGEGPEDVFITSNEYVLNNENVASATYSKSYHGTRAFTLGGDCDDPDYTGILGFVP